MSVEPELSDEVSGFDEKVSRRQIVYYGFSKFGWIMLAGVMGFLVYFYQIKLGLSAGYISLAFMIYAIWNAINDPLFGIMSDRTHHKLGRRIPYMRYGAPFLSIAFIMLWLPFVTASSQLGLFFYLLIILFFYDTFFTLVVIVNISLLGEMALTAKNRTKIAYLSGILAGVGSVIAALVPPMLLYNDQPLQKPIDPFQIFVIVVGIIGFITIFLSSYLLKEKIMFSREDQPGFIDSIKHTLKSRAFVILEVAIFAGVFLSTFVGTGISYYIDYVLNLSGFEAILPMIFFFLGNLIGGFIFMKLAGKYGMRKSLILSIPILMGGLTLVFFPTTLIETIIPLLIIGIAISAFMTFMDPLIMDCTDEDELRTGVRRESAFFGVNALITKPAESIAVSAFLTILVTVFAFLEPYIDEFGIAHPKSQPASAIFGIRFLMSFFPALVLIILLVVAYYYPLDGPKYLEMKLQVQQLHIEKEKRFLEKAAQEGLLDQDT